MSKRQVFRYVVPVDDQPHVIDLTSEPQPGPERMGPRRQVRGRQRRAAL